MPHRLPDILDTSTARVLDKAWALRVLAVEDAEILRPAVQLYQNLTQILRLCLPGTFDPKTAGAGLLRLLARAADVPDFATLEATLIEMQAKVRESFVRILGKAPYARCRLGRFFLSAAGTAARAAAAPPPACPCRASSGCACVRHAVRPAIWRSRVRARSPDGSW